MGFSLDIGLQQPHFHRACQVFCISLSSFGNCLPFWPTMSRKCTSSAEITCTELCHSLQPSPLINPSLFCRLRSLILLYQEQAEVKKSKWLNCHLSVTKTRSEIITLSARYVKSSSNTTTNRVDKAVLSISYHPHPCKGVKRFLTCTALTPDLTAKRKGLSAI